MSEKQIIDTIRDLTPEQLMELYKQAQQTRPANEPRSKRDQVIKDLQTFKPR